MRPLPLRQILLLSLACTGVTPPGTSAQQMGPRQIRDSLTSIAKDRDTVQRTRRADALAEQLAAAGRLPVGDTSVLFLFRGSARRVAVAGDFNGWDLNADSLVAIPGTGFFTTEKSFDPAARFEYKIVADGVWMLDRFNAATVMAGFGPNSEIRMPAYVPPEEIRAQPGVHRGMLDTLLVTSPILGRTHPVYVYLPAGTQRPPRAGAPPLPVIFVMDGGEYISLASMTTVLDNLIRARRIPPVAAVFVDPRTDPRVPSSSTRMQDYTMNPAFVSALVSDFRDPLIKRYGLSTSPAETGIMGASLGGLAATYAAFTRPDVFGLCGAQSPSYQWQRGAMIEMARTTPHAPIKMYIDTGTMRDALESSRRMAQVLTGLGRPIKFQTFPESHNWGNWRARIDDILEYLFPPIPSSLDLLGIQVRDTSREFSYTNKRSAFFYGATNTHRRTSWMGFHVGGRKLFDDYVISLDGLPLDRSAAVTTVYPDRLVRAYPGGVTEEFHCADSLALCWVTVRSLRPTEICFSLLRSDGHSPEDFVVQSDGDAAAVTTPVLIAPPGWICMHSPGARFPPGARGSPGGFVPISLITSPGTIHHVVFAAGNDSRSAMVTAREAIPRFEDLARTRRRRMERLVDLTAVSSSDRRFDAAFSWAVLSLDALIMHQGKKGIFAGLPWFTNYWGRDTFVSLPGAVLTTGRYREAREILLSFSSFQQCDTTSRDYGRIPNIVNPGEVAYNTADGTPRFVMMAWDYVDRSGDTGFVRTIYPTVVRSIEGTLRHHTDSLGFLVHGDAETWMDAAGPQGPWSPRGDRANDVQALWAQQLDAGIRLAKAAGDLSHQRSWKEIRKRLESNFPRMFVVNGRIVDHLNADGTPDVQERPNTIFTRRLAPAPLFEEEVRKVVSRLTYPHGVASLSQADERFHPYHEFPPFYPKDAAYHNGTVWTWLQGPLISELCRLGREDLGWKLTQEAVHQILDRGAVGTQSELLDAVARPGEREPRLSGTFSQAWNLAEFVRSFYEDYLGVTVSLRTKALQLRPRLPHSLADVRATVNLDGMPVGISIHHAGDTVRCVLDARQCTLPFTVTFRDGGNLMTFPLSRGKQTTCEIINGKARVRSGRVHVPVATRRSVPSAHLKGQLTFATPTIAAGLRTLRGPSYPLIDRVAIKSTNPGARQLVDCQDPEGDDTGVDCVAGRPLQYSYPQSPHFVRGCFDITRFTATIDSVNLYCVLRFRRLSDPGWHPEYGFQLTYCAIAVNSRPGGSTEVGHNSACSLEPSAGFERLVTVGGGVQIEDSSGTVLGAYLPVPEDVRDPLGDVRTGIISFALPLKVLGPIDSRTRFTVLVGAQDDHGGAGIGEFRTVAEKAGEWNGGGRSGGSNAYDRLDAAGGH